MWLRCKSHNNHLRWQWKAKTLRIHCSHQHRDHSCIPCVCVCVCVCVLEFVKERKWGKIGERTGFSLGGLLSTSPRQQPSVCACLVCRCHPPTVVHAPSCVWVFSLSKASSIACYQSYMMYALWLRVSNEILAVYIFRPVIREVPIPSLCSTGFGPFNLPTRGTLWNRRDHSPAQGVRRMYLVFSGLSLVCTAYMSIMFGVGANAHLFLSLSLSL